MKKDLIILLIFILFFHLLLISSINHNRQYEKKILTKLNDIGDIVDVNYYHYYYLVTTKSQIIVLDDNFHVIKEYNKKDLFSNIKSQYKYLYRNNTLMYEIKKYSGRKLTYKYYNAQTGAYINNIVLEGD